MSNVERDISESTIARIAGNLLSGVPEDWFPDGYRRVNRVMAAVSNSASNCSRSEAHARC